ncbi:MAG: ABC transporter permease [Phycisphaerales bacterium]|nr:ABC transporter permease [Phycisphaerales bacterium]
MISQVFTISRNTFLESVRQPIYFILTALCGLFILLTTATAAFSMDYSSSAEVSADDKVALDINLATVFVSGMLLAAFLATAVISKEIDRKTVLTVVSKPVSRVTVVLGKYLGVSGAILITVSTMIIWVLMAVRHKVLATTADEFDQPVLVFTTLAVLLSVGLGIWCNYFYSWSFPQVTTLILCPLMLAAYLGVLLLGPDWKPQELLHDFKPEITKASICLLSAMLVLTGVATAASARLGQVMTLVICAGVFVFGLMSNHLIGRFAIDNTFIARIQSATPQRDGMAALINPEDTYDLKLETEPRVRMAPGTPVYFGPNPSGYRLVTPDFEPFKGDVANMSDLSDRTKPAALAVLNQKARDLTIVRTGTPGALVSRPPREGDFVFTRPTRFNYAAWGVWGIIPNVQAFWLLDAVSQNQKIPMSHVAMVVVYGLMQVGVFLSLAVILFQKREVG